MTKPKIDPALHQAKSPTGSRSGCHQIPVFFDQGAHCRSSLAQFAKALSAPIDGSVGATVRHLHDRRRPLYARLRHRAVTTAKPFALEADEPQRVAEAVGRLKLRHVVITAVARDDLEDGARHFANTILAIRKMDPKIIVEVLTPTFTAKNPPCASSWRRIPKSSTTILKRSSG